MKNKINEWLNEFIKYIEEENKYLTGFWTGMMLAIAALVTIVSAILIIYGYQEFGIMLIFAGIVGIIVCFVFDTRKHIERKDETGKKLKIYYAVGFVLVVAMVLFLVQSCEMLECGFPRRTSELSFLIFYALIGLAERTIKKIKKEEAKLKEATKSVTA